MDWHYFLSELLKALGAGSVLSLSLAFLFRKGLAHWLTKDLENYKSDLQRSLERFKHRHSLLAEKQLEAIAVLFTKIVDLKETIVDLKVTTENMQHVGSGEPMSAELEKVKGHFLDYQAFYKHTCILFPRELSKQISDTLWLLSDLKRSIYSLGKMEPGNPAVASRIEKNDDLQIKLQRTIEALEDAFRNILHGEE